MQNFPRHKPVSPVSPEELRSMEFTSVHASVDVGANGYTVEAVWGMKPDGSMVLVALGELKPTVDLERSEWRVAP